MSRISAVIAIVGFFGTALGAFAQMASTNYEIRWDTVGNGGDDFSESASYILRDTVGNAGIGQGTSASYDLRAGYRQGIFDQVIDFELFLQDSDTGRAATASAGTTITCDTSGLAVGDMVVLIEDEGDGQVSAIGRITAVGVGTITVDELKDGGVAPVIDGSDDFVYVLGGTFVDLDELDDALVRTSVIGIEVTADIDGGYVVQLLDDGDLRDGAETVDDVADGDVTAGSEEYGGRSSDSTLAGSTFDTADTAITTAFQDIADRSDISFDSRDFLTLLAAIDSSTSVGDYSHDLTLIVSGNF
jgi:hypothetical protein